MTDSIEHMMSKMTLEQLNEMNKSAGDYSYSEKEYKELLDSYTEFLKENMGPQD